MPLQVQGAGPTALKTTSLKARALVFSSHTVKTLASSGCRRRQASVYVRTQRGHGPVLGFRVQALKADARVDVRRAHRHVQVASNDHLQRCPSTRSHLLLVHVMTGTVATFGNQPNLLTVSAQTTIPLLITKYSNGSVRGISRRLSVLFMELSVPSQGFGDSK